MAVISWYWCGNQISQWKCEQQTTRGILDRIEYRLCTYQWSAYSVQSLEHDDWHKYNDESLKNSHFYITCSCWLDVVISGEMRPADNTVSTGCPQGATFVCYSSDCNNPCFSSYWVLRELVPSSAATAGDHTRGWHAFRGNNFVNAHWA